MLTTLPSFQQVQKQHIDCSGSSECISKLDKKVEDKAERIEIILY